MSEARIKKELLEELLSEYKKSEEALNIFLKKHADCVHKDMMDKDKLLAKRDSYGSAGVYFEQYDQLQRRLAHLQVQLLMQQEKKSELIPEDKNELPTVHYLWIGPPSKSSPRHDIHDVALMASHKKNPIKFWCLAEHLEEYKKVFSEQPNIQVHAIDTFVKKTCGDKHSENRNAALSVSHMQQVMLHGEGRGEIRDRVSCKDMYALFLLSVEGGYVLDTNIGPMGPTEKKALPNYPEFRTVAIQDESGQLDWENWMMYAPKGGHEQARKALEIYRKNGI